MSSRLWLRCLAVHNIFLGLSSLCLAQCSLWPLSRNQPGSQASLPFLQRGPWPGQGHPL